jgi:putative hydrolase of the HAD superfamily
MAMTDPVCPAPRRGALARTLFIDADDTLWENDIFYLRASLQLADYMVSLGCARDAVQPMLDECERELIPTYGYSPQGYITALGMACTRLLYDVGRTALAEQVAAARACGDGILHPPVELLAGVAPTLAALYPANRLVLVTKGDEAHQKDKLARSGLGCYFDSVYVLREKHPAAYQQIVAELGLDLYTTWMVGNSPRSDINPAVEAGLRAVFLPHEHTWQAELQEIAQPARVVVLERFADLAGLFGDDHAA